MNVYCTSSETTIGHGGHPYTRYEFSSAKLEDRYPSLQPLSNKKSKKKEKPLKPVVNITIYNCNLDSIMFEVGVSYSLEEIADHLNAI